MKGFSIEDFCKETGYDKEQVSVTLNAASDHIYRMAFSKFIGHSGPLVDSIADAVDKKISGKNHNFAMTEGRKAARSRKGEFYAPYKELIPCNVLKTFANNNGTVTMVFESVNPREYGNGEPINFTETSVLTADQVIDLFYARSDGSDPDSEPMYQARQEVLQKIPNLPKASDIPNVFMSFLYNVEIKRVVADYRDPVEVLSITPCGVLQNANNQL